MALTRRSFAVPTGPEIIAQAPSGVNPYAYLRSFIDDILTPHMPDAFFVNLALLSALLVAGAAVSLAVLVLPIKQGSESVRRNLWIVKRKYVSEYSQPYYVPNFVVAYALAFLTHDMLAQIYIWTNFGAYRDTTSSLKVQLQTHLFLWYGMIWIPGFLGLWFAGFSGLYAAWFSVPASIEPSKTHSWLRPSILNVVCYGVPVVVALTTLTSATYEDAKHQTLLSQSTPFLANLDQAADQWNQTRQTTDHLQTSLTEESILFRSRAQSFLTAFSTCLGIWSAWTFLTCCVFGIALVGLLAFLTNKLKSIGARTISIKTFRRDFNSLDKNHWGNTTNQHKELGPRHWKRWSILGPAGAGTDVRVTDEVTTLRRMYFTTLIHFTSLLTLLSVMLVTSLWTSSDLVEIEFNSNLRASTILLGIWPQAIFGTLGMSFLLHRIFTTSRITLPTTSTPLHQCNAFERSREERRRTSTSPSIEVGHVSEQVVSLEPNSSEHAEYPPIQDYEVTTQIPEICTDT